MNYQRPVQLAGHVGLGILLSLGTLSAPGATNTNDTTRIIASAKSYEAHLVKKPDENQSFLEHLEWQIPIHGERSSIQELDYPADFSLLREHLLDDYDPEDMTERGMEIFEDTILDSLRDSIIGWLNLDRFKRRNKPIKYFSAKLFEGSIGGTLEESRRDALSLDPNNVESTKQWAKSFTRQNRVQYGIKPFHSSPYGYMSVGFGSQKGKMPLLIANTRIHSVIMKEGVPRLKQEFLIPFGSYAQLSIGASCYPTEFDKEGYKSQFASRFSTEIGRAIVYASLGSTRDETLAIAGLSLKF